MINDLANLSSYNEIVLIIGMYGKNISPSLHNSIVKSHNNIKNLKIYYTNNLVHSRCYSWYRNGALEDFLIGSANFSINALLENPFKKSLCKVNDKFAKLQFIEYVNYIMNDLYIYTNLNLTTSSNSNQSNKVNTYKIPFSNQKYKISLLSSEKGKVPNIIELKCGKKDVHASSGLNWGYSFGDPLLGDAYIPISKETINKYSGLIPQKPKCQNKPIKVLWDDGETMLLLFEGNGPLAGNNSFYPKNIGTYRKKVI